MELFVIAIVLLVFILVVLIGAPKGMREDEKEKRLEKVSSVIDNPAYAELQQSFYDRFIGKSVKKAGKAFAKFMPKKKTNVNNKNKNLEQIQKQLRLAGMFMDAADFQFIKTIFMVVVVTITLIILLILKLDAMYMVLVLCVGGAIGIMGPTFYLRSRVSKHQVGIRKQLPDAMDLLCVCIEAGLSFDASLIKVAEKLSGPFIDELMIVHREIQMGRSRREAVMNMGDSSSVEELKTFASALAQAETMGIPINNVMRAQSDQLRVSRSQAAKEKGMKASIKMLIPMLLFIFPVVFIILMGPTVMNVINTF